MTKVLRVCDFCAGTVNNDKLRAELRSERLALGLKATWVAGELGIDRAELCALEMGRTRISGKRYLQYRAVLDREGKAT